MTAVPIVEEPELRRVAELIARLSPTQQRLAVMVADGFRAGWLDPEEWARSWRGSDLSDARVAGDALTWLVRLARRRQYRAGDVAGVGAG
jgi:hypothetical protein